MNGGAYTASACEKGLRRREPFPAMKRQRHIKMIIAACNIHE